MSTNNSDIYSVCAPPEKNEARRATLASFHTFSRHQDRSSSELRDRCFEFPPPCERLKLCRAGWSFAARQEVEVQRVRDVSSETSVLSIELRRPLIMNDLRRSVFKNVKSDTQGHANSLSFSRVE